MVRQTNTVSKRDSAFPRSETPWFNRSELASFGIKAGGFKTGKYSSLCETVFV